MWTDGLFYDNFCFYICLRMKLSKLLFNFLNKKSIVLTLISVTAIVAFASLGDGKSKYKKTSLLNTRTIVTPGKFSLRSGYQYRGSQVINQQKTDNIITLNSQVTYQKGNLTYIMPLKTTVNMQKLKFSVGVPQLNK